MDLLTQYDTMVTAVAAHAAQRPDKPFLIIETDGGQHVTSFRELTDQARRYANLYVRRGIAPGERIAMMFTMHPALAPAFLGAIMAGAVPFVLPTMTVKQNPALFWKAQLVTLERSDCRLILTDATTADLLRVYAPSMAGRAVDADTIDFELLTNILPEIPLARDMTAFLQHSSGTTGAKKGVMLTHGMVLDFTHALGTALQITETDIIASWLPLYHDMGLIGCLVLPMLLGLTTVHMSPFDWVTRPATLLDMIERHRATLCWQPNFAFQHLTRTAPRNRDWDLSSMRAFINCSESCKPDTNAVFLERFAGSGLGPKNLQVSYGMAENVFVATQTDMQGQPRVIIADLAAFDEGRIAAPQDGAASLKILSTGYPIPKTQIQIRDADQKILPERQLGQITVTSPYLFSGYHRSDLAEKTLVDGWYMTGDFGFLDGGEVFVCGRRDELLIINGRNIFAPDIEFSINRNTAVKPGRCVAIGPFNARTGSQSLVVIAETEDLSEPARADLASAIKTLINAEFGLLASDVWITDVGWMAKTTSGKISRGANEARYLQDRAAR